MRVDLFDFNLPEDRIALHPAEPRESARLLHVGKTGNLTDRTISDLPDLVAPNDLVVVNNTRVLPAELKGTRLRGTLRAGVSFNLHKRASPESWWAFARPAKKLKTGDRVELGPEEDRACALVKLDATVAEIGEAGQVLLRFDLSGAYLDEAIKAMGAMPLPPYISSRRTVGPEDERDYQTIFARHDGAVAAPTAGLHFTDRLRDKLAAKGVAIGEVTLHVGAGTFLPVKADATEDHVMHAEWISVSPELVEQVRAAKANGGRIIAVGTTSLRSLEAASQRNGSLERFEGETDIFITPGYRFRTVDVLMTNFHLPRSTLFMLVSAFSGLEQMKSAYAHAISTGYRFYSYGDACWLERNDGVKAPA